MGTDFYGYTNRSTRELSQLLGDYLLGYGDWIGSELDFYSEEGYSKKQAKECLAVEIEDYMRQSRVNLKELADPVERLFIIEPDELDEEIDYLQIAEGWVRDYSPAKKKAAPKKPSSAKAPAKKKTGNTRKNTSTRRY